MVRSRVGGAGGSGGGANSVYWSDGVTVTEPDQDANTILAELDSDLRSMEIGKQCEAIVRFPRFFERYPFPILINASFLKLSDIFRAGNNFLRLWVMRVFQQSEKHLDKIMNVDEIVKRIFSVMHSNDPVARSLTLRTLGALSCIISERRQVHHAIRQALDSHDKVEVHAAIFAASQFASQSKTFAVSMMNKITEMVSGQATPAGMKLSLLPALRHMHHDAAAAGPVRTLLTSLMPRLPSAPFLRLILRTLTHLAAATLIDIPDQVELLLDQLCAARASVRTAAVEGLAKLASNGRANLWPPDAAKTLSQKALQLAEYDSKCLVSCLSVIELLMKDPLMVQSNMHPDSSVRELCSMTLYDQNLIIASKAAHILTVMAVHCYQEALSVHDIDEVIIGLESLIIISGQEKESTDNLEQLKLTLKCVIQICECSAEQCPRLVNLIGNEIEDATGKRGAALTAALGAIGSRRPSQIRSVLPNILRKLQNMFSETVSQKDSESMQVVVEPSEDSTELNTLIVLCTIVFQMMAGHSWPEEVLKVVNNAIAPTNLWIQFRIARAAMRYGQYSVAAELLGRVATRAGSELAHHWLGALHLIAQAESVLQASTSDNLQENVRNAITMYHRAMAALKAGWSGGQCASFQWEYVRLRVEVLGALSHILATCCAFCMQPPPAIANSQAQGMRDEFLKCGHITQQLRKATAELRSLAEGYCRLYQSSFDADLLSLEHVQIIQQMCSLMAQSLERLSTANVQDQAFPDFIQTTDLSQYSLESQLLINMCQKINEISTKMMDPHEIKPVIISHKQIQGIWKQAAVICRGPLPTPRFLFQALQNTSVRLSISPQPTANGDPISVPNNQQLAIKVEGVIHTGSRPGLFRKIASVHLSLTAHLQRSSNVKSDLAPPFVTLTDNIKPAKDFFSAQLLLNLTIPSMGGNGANVLMAIEASLLDETGALWRTGPRHTLNIKVLEDPINKNSQANQQKRY